MWRGWFQGVEKEVKTLLLKKQHLEGKSESPGSKHTSHATDGSLEKKKKKGADQTPLESTSV